jgi:hypothetical protein
VPLSSNIRDLSAMPERRARYADDEITVGLQAGLELEETEGVDFADGGLDARRGALRDRARAHGLKQVSRSLLDEDRRPVLIVQWYRDQPGDLRAREQDGELGAAREAIEPDVREATAEVRMRERPRRWRLRRRG